MTDKHRETVDRVVSVVNRLKRLPGKARAEGHDSPAVWTTLGECIAELQQIAEAEGKKNG